MAEHDLEGELDAFLAGHGPELIEFRRDLHAHPETGYHEYRTTRRIALRLEAAGLKPAILPKGTGLTVDIGTGSADEPVVALRADIDALPINDEKDVPYRSINRGACHACGHDVHTSILLGTGLFLARVAAARALPGKVRLIFQPAEEVPGGAVDVLAAGGIASVDRIFALHCDPRLDVGKIGTRTGPITAACDKLTVKVTGPGGHTARPHLTADLVYALGKIITELPAALSRRVDPRSSLSLVWGRVNAGSAANAIPDDGMVEGTVRCLDDTAWHEAPELVKALLESVASAYGVVPEIIYQRNVPPTVNEAMSTAMFEAAADRVLGPDSITEAPQSLGGEDFAWYLESIPGALARLGTRTPEAPADFYIHQGIFDVDERAIGCGVRLLAATALTAMSAGGEVAPDAMPGATATRKQIAGAALA
jgi:amidohydrolase